MSQSRSPRDPKRQGRRGRASSGRRGFQSNGSPSDTRGKRGGGPSSIHLSDDIVKELKSTARPGKGDILVKVFAEAATVFAEEKYDEAIGIGEQAKHIALRSATVRELLGLAYYRAERWKEAARELAAFRRLLPGDREAPEGTRDLRRDRRASRRRADPL
jgi:tetratricopeptide (TPR) repeat protein